MLPQCALPGCCCGRALWEINGFSQVGAKIILTTSETSCQTLDRVPDLDLGIGLRDGGRTRGEIAAQVTKRVIIRVIVVAIYAIYAV